MEAFGYISSFIMGMTLGLMGGGGSILTVPILVYLFGLAPSVATGYSLFVVGVTALIGGGVYLTKGDVDFRVGLSFAIPSILGVNVSRGWLVPSLPTTVATLGSITISKEVLIMAAFAVMMVLASVSMIRGRKAGESIQRSKFSRAFVIGVQGFLVGVVAGFVGAGGGFLIIPALVVFAGLSMRVAVGTSLMVIAAQSLLGFAGDVSRGAEIQWTLLLTLSLIAAFGILMGSRLAQKVKEQKLKIAFGWFVLVMGTVILIEQVRHL